MGKKVLIITTSLRANSNSDGLAKAFARGAQEAGNVVETVSLKGKNISFCRGCLICQKTQECVIRDDASLIAQKALNADVLVFATPVYYYGMSGQLKTLLDRCNPLFSSSYAFREIYLLAAAAEDEKDTVTGTATGIRGWVDCFEKARFAGMVFAGGVNESGAVQGHPAEEKAYELGKSVE